ncbi:Ribosomal RNA small subunit methyltransferase B [Aquicella siphonis]|uniref:16S rRNA (cytosine(967)-C(5))-methyltransferase n=1 Tax=Aquicella siphonis TaxID=254247 RepID=A0A5E4PE12_9COXI|nr:16S rRNA (cytosine(967)-C(5))-methyltransferase RsmB [Aquicella siphonis]VVC74825.1 Ribosomal RNA small subunit methyltransferase B [Aquicella siphonis]
MMNLRLAAARIIDQVTDGRSLSDCLDAPLSAVKDARDRAWVHALCYGVCRYYTRLDAVLGHLLQKPMKAKDSDVHALLLTGLYQLMYMRVPDYAAVTETVNATAQLKKTWARGLVNAVLREYLRSRDRIEKTLEADPEASFAHPQWWIDAVRQDWPYHWQSILHANNQHPPFALRVNRRLISRDKYLEKLADAGHPAKAIPETDSGIILETPVAADELPGFSAGEISVQDGAAQLAAGLLDLAPHLRVLDACAAPGGKLTHILEIMPDLAGLSAIEKEPSRLPQITENLNRLNMRADLFCHDANDVSGWWDGRLFDRVLVDAPCSASGVVRRHPDIKLLRRQSDVGMLAAEQRRLLASLWQVLKPGGFLVYATCSVFLQENVFVLRDFMRSHQDAAEDKLIVDWGLPCEIGRQIIPGMHDMDGFYYARLRKLPSGC